MTREIVFDHDNGRVIKEEIKSEKFSKLHKKKVKYNKKIYIARKNNGEKKQFTRLKSAKDFIIKK